jgi:hypothetical protein
VWIEESACEFFTGDWGITGEKVDLREGMGMLSIEKKIFFPLTLACRAFSRSPRAILRLSDDDRRVKS